MMKAVWHGEVIAESDRAQEVGGYWYFPRDAVRMDRLRPAPRTPHDMACPHGVQFYDVVRDGTPSSRAAWSYEAPRGAMKRVDHWVGFWEDIETV